LCVCACVRKKLGGERGSTRARTRVRAREIDRKRERRETHRDTVHVCMYVHARERERLKLVEGCGIEAIHTDAHIQTQILCIHTHTDRAFDIF